MQDNKYGRLLLDMLVFSIGTVLAKAVQFLLMPLYTSFMTTEAYGVAELTNNLSEFFFPIVTLCIYEAVLRFTIDSHYNKQEVITISVKMLMASSVIGAGVFFLWNAFFPYEYIQYLFFVLYTYSFRMLLAAYVRGKGYTKVYASSGIINAVFLAVFSYIFLVTFQWGIRGYLSAIGFAYLISTVYIFIGGKVAEDLHWNCKNKSLFKEMLDYSSPLILYNMGYWLTVMSGKYILIWKSGASAAGSYAAVLKISAMINMFQQAFFAAFQLNNSREYSSTDRENYYSNVFNLYAAVILAAGSVALIASPLIAKITLQKGFYEARAYLPLILYVAIFDCVFCFYKTMYTTFKLTRRAIPSMFVGAAINIIVSMVTVAKFGIWGICFASLLCSLSQTIYRVFDVNQFVKINCNWKKMGLLLFAISVQMFMMLQETRTAWYIALCISICMMLLSVDVCLKTYRKIR